MAFETVNEAIRVATERHARVPECLARIVRGKLMLQSTNDDERDEGAKELERTKVLMRETGAVLFEPFINADVMHDSGRSVRLA